MNRCPITYQECRGGYSRKGLGKLSRTLTDLHVFPYSTREQLREAAARAPRMSIQGVQPKLSAILAPMKKTFEIVTTGGRYILKPQNPQFFQLPENEDLSMRLAAAAGLETPLHGLLYSKDGSMTYFIKRFDRIGGKKKLALEDFAQLSGLSRETKYDASMEKVAKVIERYCTFPALEKIKLFKSTLVNYLIGNEDMHLKNFSLITRDDKVELSPLYDILNTTIALENAREEIALPLKGRKRKLNRSILVEYFGRERLGLSPKSIARALDKVESVFPRWEELIHRGFLAAALKEDFFNLVKERRKVLFHH